MQKWQRHRGTTTDTCVEHWWRSSIQCPHRICHVKNSKTIWTIPSPWLNCQMSCYDSMWSPNEKWTRNMNYKLTWKFKPGSGEIRSGILQSITKMEQAQARSRNSSLTKFDINPFNCLSENMQKPPKNDDTQHISHVSWRASPVSTWSMAKFKLTCYL